MSAVSSTTSSGVDYAMQLATASALRRSLNNIGTAVQNGDLTTANTLLTAFIKDNPQYAASSSGSASQDPISQDFQALATAVSSNQVGAAQSAWSQVKNDLAKDGVNLSNGTASTAEVIAQSKASLDQELISDIFGSSSSGGGTSLASLLNGSSDSSSSVGSNSPANPWVTYEPTGNVTSSTTSSAIGNFLDASV